MKQGFKGWPLASVLVLALLGFCIVPAAIVGGLLYRNNSQTVDVLAERIVDNVAVRVQQGMQDHMQASHQVLNGLIQAYPSQSELDRARSLILNPDQFEKAAYAMTRMSEAVTYIYSGNLKGEFHGIETLQQGISRATRIGVRGKGDEGRRFFLAEFPGDRSTSLPTEAKNYEPRTRPWYQAAVEAKGRVLTKVYPSASKKQLLVTLAQPVYGEDGGALGVFATDIFLQHLNDVLTRTPISNRGIAFLVDEDGDLVAGSAGDPLFVEKEGKLQRVKPAASANALLSAVHHLVESDLGKNEADSVKRVQYTKRMGSSDDSMIVVLKPFGESLGLRWTLVVAAPENDFAEGSQKALRTSVFVMLGLIALAAILATVMALRLAKRFKRLSLAAQQMALGEVPAVQTDAGIAEVRTLSQTLHDSAAQIIHNKLEIETQAHALRDANEHLEDRVAQRTHQLNESREEALQAAKAKAAFLATMSHEIRTPLNGVVGMTTLLADTPLNAEQQDYLHIMRISSDQLLSVINDILDYSKIESGKLDMESEPLSIQHTIEEACDIGAPRAREKGLEVLIDMGDAVPAWVRGDVTRLRQILLNFLNNAIKFTESGQIVVSAHLKEDFDVDRVVDGKHLHGALIEFRVKDTGIGIPKDRQSALFQSFTQVDASTTRKYGGTGLGLAICKRLAELMGGQVGLESQEGQGSTFWFTARMDYADAPEHSDSSLLEMASLDGKFAVLVDDTPVNLQILEKQLKRWNMNTISFDRVQPALDWLVTGKADVIITDMHMPEMDGLAFAKVCGDRTVMGKPATPMILLTSGGMPVGDDAEYFSSRLLKPYRQSQLFGALARLSVVPSKTSTPEQKVVLRKGQTILVADDNAVNLKVAVSMLTKLGYDSVTVINGELAKQAVDASLIAGGKEYAAVLMDVNMPVMDGFESTRLILSAHGKAAPPIIALTASVLEEDRQRCLDAGMIGFLPKPLRMDELSQALAKYVRIPMTPAPHPAAHEPSVAANPESGFGVSSFPSFESKAPEQPQELMDWSRLDQFKEFDDEERTMTREVISLFLQDAPGRRDEILQSLGTTDPSLLSLRAHALKGAASNVGAMVLSMACAKLEHDCKTTGWPQDAKAQIEGIDGLTDQTVLILRNWQP